MVTNSGRLPDAVRQAVKALEGSVCAPASTGVGNAAAAGDHRRRQVHAAETRLLYQNATTGIVSTILIALALAYVLSRGSIPGVPVWLLYTILVAIVRFEIARRYRQAAPDEGAHARWNTAFVAGTVLASAGWAAAGLAFYQTAQPRLGVFLVFVIGGVMLGGASLLAARPEAFLAFLLPTGLLTSARLAAEGGQEHLMMGFLGTVFTAATVATTWRFHRTIASSLELRFDNEDLINSLKAAKSHTDALNRELELRVLDRTARLTDADRRKDEFLATLAHELRNPLAPIRFALENLKSNTQVTAAQARDVIDRQVRQLVRLVDDLLDVSRITTNKLVLRREPHDLWALMATSVESVMPLATAAGHVLIVETPMRPIAIDCDGARIVQVFANVLHNAVKFTPRGGRVEFRAGEEAGEAVIRVRDTGIGIPADLLPRVFDLFQQAAPVLERSSGGLGIGLTLARRLVEMHGGRIAISSAGPNQGTDVEIHLAIAASAEARAPAADPPATPASRRLRVLIVEDNTDTAAMLEMAVAQRGHETRVAHDGGGAVATAEAFAPDLILLDIGLPMMSGYDVARALRGRQQFERVHVAAVTGWGQDEDRRQAREAGCNSHFTKPLAPAALEDLLAAVARAGASGPDTTGTPRTRFTDSASF